LVEAPAAWLTASDRDHQFLIGSHGLSEAVGPGSHAWFDAICRHVAASNRPLIVYDAAVDERLVSRLAAAQGGVAALAGFPLITAEGCAVGGLCVVDFVPRDWTDDRLATLAELAAAATDEIRQIGLDRQVAQEPGWRGAPTHPSRPRLRTISGRWP
jgi:GAF domain-containing protein